MDRYKEFIETYSRLLSVSNERSKIGRDYGTGHKLHQSEIHTIQAIGNHPQCNASALAKLMGITNGAITQVISKLEKKSLVYKYKLPDNNKEVYFALTKAGQKANQGHNEFHKKIYQSVSNYLDGLGRNELDAIKGFMDHIINGIPKEDK